MTIGSDVRRHVFFVSDSTGITVETLGNALLSQFDHVRRPGTACASPSRCRTEVREAEALFERHRIPSLDTSAASIEEIASRVLLRTGLRRHAY